MEDAEDFNATFHRAVEDEVPLKAADTGHAKAGEVGGTESSGRPHFGHLGQFSEGVLHRLQEAITSLGAVLGQERCGTVYVATALRRSQD